MNKTPKPLAALTITAVLTAALVVPVSAPVLAGCGGCPWTSSSDVDVSPEATCLDLEVSDGDRHLPNGEGGCVNPILFGTNNCAEPLTLPATDTTGDDAVVVQPGASFEIAVPLDRATTSGDDYDFVISATLGSDAISIAFTTFAP